MSPDTAALYRDHFDVLCRRHDGALEAAGLDAVAIYSGTPKMLFLDDSPYPFRTNPHFKTWVPLLAHPFCFVVYRPGTRPRLVFFQPVDYWHKPPADPEGVWTGHFDIQVIREPDEARVLLDLAGDQCAFIGEWDSRFDEWGFGPQNPPTLLNPLHFARCRKTGHELNCMEQATRRAVAGHRAAEQAFCAGRSEYEIHLEYCRAAGQGEGELPYSNIVALNENAAVLHYTDRTHQRFADTDRHSFLIDAGADSAGYAADITRTYSARDGAFQDLIDDMDDAQQRLCLAVKPGLYYPDLHQQAHLEIARILAAHGLAEGTAEGLVESGITRVFLPHGLGHFLGLQVHDVAGFMVDPQGNIEAPPAEHPFLRLTRTLEPGNVLTIEPGLYFIPTLLDPLRDRSAGRVLNWTKIDQLARYGGIRIEDNVAVTATGSDNLTRRAFAAAA